MNKAFVFAISATAALGGLLFGFDTAIISGAIPSLKSYFGVDDWLLGWTVSSVLPGCALGAIIAGRLADKSGRRWVLVQCTILFALSGLGAGLAHSLPAFIAFRVLGGLGVGAAAMVAPMYIAEMAPPAWRGRLVALYQLAIVSGILLAYGSNWLFIGWKETGWRWMFASQAAPALLFLILLAFVPETPRWLVKKGRMEKAGTILHNSGVNDIAGELSAIRSSFGQEGRTSWKEPLSPAYRTVIGIGVMLAVIRQVTGINAVLYYAPLIFKEPGLDSSSALLQTMGIGLALFLATLCLWLADFTVTYTFPVFTRRLGIPATFGAYAACCVLAFLYISYRVRETRNKTLEEIGTLFTRNKRP